MRTLRSPAHSEHKTVQVRWFTLLMLHYVAIMPDKLFCHHNISYILVSLCRCVPIAISLLGESFCDSWSQTWPHLSHLGSLLRLRPLTAWQQALAWTCDLPARLARVQPILLSTHYTLVNRWRWALSTLFCNVSIVIFLLCHYIFKFIDKCLVLVWARSHVPLMSKNQRSESELYLLSYLATITLILRTREAAW